MDYIASSFGFLGNLGPDDVAPRLKEISREKAKRLAWDAKRLVDLETQERFEKDLGMHVGCDDADEDVVLYHGDVVLIGHEVPGPGRQGTRIRWFRASIL